MLCNAGSRFSLSLPHFPWLSLDMMCLGGFVQEKATSETQGVAVVYIFSCPYWLRDHDIGITAVGDGISLSFLEG